MARLPVTFEGMASTGKHERGKIVMALRFLAIDPDTIGLNCPALFVDDGTGDLLFQGSVVDDPGMLAEADKHSPIGDNESLVRLPARMRAIILEALSGDGTAVQRVDRDDDSHCGALGDEGRLHAV